jgi:hypothetical protein
MKTEQKLVKFKPPEDQTGALTFGPGVVEAPRAIMLNPMVHV